MSAGTTYVSDAEQELKKAFKKAVAISMAAHLALLGGASIAGYFNHKPKGLETRSIQVRLLAPPKTGKPGPAKKPKAVAPPAPKPKTPEPKKPEPKKLPAPAIAPQPKKPDPKKEEKPAPKEPEKKPEPEKEVPPEPSMPADKMQDIQLARAMIHEKSGAGDNEAQWESAMEGLEGDARILSYYYEAGETLKQSWRIPLSVPTNQGLYVEFIIEVDQQGNIINYEIINQSTNSGLNRSIIDLLQRVEKLQPVPFSLESGSLKIPYHFEPSEN